MPELVFFRRGEEVLRLGLGRQRTVLGSAEPSDVVLPDPQISPRHVALRYDGTRCLLEDLSGQGTLVAGNLLERGELPDGADLALGMWRAVFRLSSSNESEAPSRGAQRTDVQPPQAQEPRGAPARLRVRQGDTEMLHQLDAERFTVGKDPANTVVIQDRFISHKHLEVKRRESGFYVRDLNSTNGTFMGGVRLFEAEIPLNTVLRVGEAELHFEPISEDPQALHGIIGRDPSVRQLVEQAARVAASNLTVVILGESGTGKELVARVLHECSPRAGHPFVPLNCAALPRELIESELFGHEKGAFSGADSQRKGAFEEAHGGTLFLDEIGELPLELQAKLLRALENGEIKPVGASRPRHVDVRVVAATNRDLLAHTRAGKFREDLYYRLCVIPLVLPPLRRRGGDLDLLARHFVQLHAPRGQRVRLTLAALDKLHQHSWPGNVRELRNVILRALLLRQGPEIDARDISWDSPARREPEGPSDRELELPEGLTLEQMLERLERQLVESTLRRNHHNKERAARQLGLSRSTLFRRLKQWGLVSEDEAPD
jgi:DNA-binding NtrC family response regulator